MNKLDQPYTHAKIIKDPLENVQKVDCDNFDGLDLQVDQQLEDTIISYALRVQKSLASLDKQDFVTMYEDFYRIYTKKLDFLFDHYQAIVQIVLGRIEYKLEQGNAEILGKTILHTAPHHDDIVLGYHSYAMRLLQSNQNYILYVTNGSNGVSNDYLLSLIQGCLAYDPDILRVHVFEHFYEQLLEQFAQAFHSQNQILMQQARQFIFLKIVIELYSCMHVDQLQQQIAWLHEYLLQESEWNNTTLEDSLIDTLKGRLRQSESDSKWTIAQGHCNNVLHFGATFYTHDRDQAIDHDVQNLVIYLKNIKPDMITVALDPCGVGPTTHFMTLQIIAQALQIYGDDSIEIIGYRNVWAAFTISQTGMIVPVTNEDIVTLQSVFLNCFATQKNPLFPSPLHDGPFSDIVLQFLEQQGDDIALLLGQKKVSDYLYLQKLSVDELLQFTQKLKI